MQQNMKNSKNTVGRVPSLQCRQVFTMTTHPQQNSPFHCSSKLKHANSRIEAAPACARWQRRNMICSTEVEFVHVTHRKLPASA